MLFKLMEQKFFHNFLITLKILELSIIYALQGRIKEGFKAKKMLTGTNTVDEFFYIYFDDCYFYFTSSSIV